MSREGGQTPARSVVVILALLAAGLSAGCQDRITFPAESLAVAAREADAFGAYDAAGDGRADFFLYADEAGRVDRIAYDHNADGRPDEVIPLDAIPFARCRHVVIILDGFGYDVVREYYDAGGLRVFHRPSRVVSPYPTMTDLAMEDALGYIPCRGFEAKYFDRKANRIVGGDLAYLRGSNEPYNRLLHYRARSMWDVVGYLAPWRVFAKETNDAKRLFDKARTREMLAYFVSSAGISTRHGREGQIRCLKRVERMILQILRQTRGLTKFTLLADHGHCYTPCRRLDIEGHLKGRGWRLAKTLRGERDVAFIRFGLVTYASFATRRPAALAKDLAELDGVELVSFADGDTVVVLGGDGGRAVIRAKPPRYAYTPVNGDPLAMKEILAAMGADDEGFHHADALLSATIDHHWPAPLQRLWRAHFALVENPPDVIASLADGVMSGAKGFGSKIDVASTHGGLNRLNSTTFIMSTAGPMPPFMRSGDVPRNMRRLTGEDFPLGK